MSLTKIAFSMIGLLMSSQAFAWSSSAEFSCVQDGQLIAWMVTPVRPWGYVSEEDVAAAKQRCEAIGGQLGKRKPIQTPPPGAV